MDASNFVGRTIFEVVTGTSDLPLHKNHIYIAIFMYRLNDDLKQD